MDESVRLLPRWLGAIDVSEAEAHKQGAMTSANGRGVCDIVSALASVAKQHR